HQDQFVLDLLEQVEESWADLQKKAQITTSLRIQKPHFMDFGLCLMIRLKHESSIQIEDFSTALGSYSLA
nr:hypothetical protein [Tanacetum cinerariifolium]